MGSSSEHGGSQGWCRRRSFFGRAGDVHKARRGDHTAEPDCGIPPKDCRVSSAANACPPISSAECVWAVRHVRRSGTVFLGSCILPELPAGQNGSLLDCPVGRLFRVQKHSAASHEEFCREHFHSWLITRVPVSAVHWRRGDDPPDFELRIDGVRWSVEVSRIMNEHIATASSSLERAIERLGVELTREGVLAGIFSVDLEEPIPRGASHRAEFVRRTREALVACSREPRARYDVEICGHRVAIVERVADGGSAVYCNGIGSGGWVDEMRAEYLACVPDLLRRKASILARRRPAVLLLHDVICPIGDPALLGDVISAVPEAADFELIYVIRSNRPGLILQGAQDWPQR